MAETKEIPVVESSVAGSSVGKPQAEGQIVGNSVAEGSVAGSSVAGSSVAGSSVAGSSVEVWVTLQMSLCLERSLFVTNTPRGTEVTKFIETIMPMWLSKRTEAFWNNIVSEHKEKLARETSEHDEAEAGYPFTETEDYERIKGIADLPFIWAADLTIASFLVLRGDWYLSPGFVFMKDTSITIYVRQMDGMSVLAPQGDAYSSKWILQGRCQETGFKMKISTGSAPGPDSMIMTTITVTGPHKEWLQQALAKTKEISEENAAKLILKEVFPE